MRHAYTKIYFFVVYLKFKFNWSPIFLIAKLGLKAPSFQGNDLSDFPGDFPGSRP